MATPISLSLNFTEKHVSFCSCKYFAQASWLFSSANMCVSFLLSSGKHSLLIISFLNLTKRKKAKFVWSNRLFSSILFHSSIPSGSLFYEQIEILQICVDICKWLFKSHSFFSFKKNVLALVIWVYPNKNKSFFASNVWIDGHISEVILQYRNLIFIIKELHLVQSFWYRYLIERNFLLLWRKSYL